MRIGQASLGYCWSASRALLVFGLLSCGASEPASKATQDSDVVTVQVLAFNDFHGHLEPPSGRNGQLGGETVGGLAHMSALLESLRAKAEHTVTVSAGDLIGASPLVSALFHDEPTIELMEDVGLDINGVGNHEFDEGWEELKRIKEGGCHPEDGCGDRPPYDGASFSFLAANVQHKSTGDTVFPGSEVRTFDGVKVGFIGLTFEGTQDIVVQEGIASLTFEPERDAINRVATSLRAEGVETIVVLVHEGGLVTGDYNGCDGISGPIVDLVEATDDAVDVFVTGHTHRAYNCRVDGRVVTSAASYGRAVSEITLTIDRESGDVASSTSVNHLVLRDRATPQITRSVQTAVDAADPVAGRVVTTLSAALTRERNAAGQSSLGVTTANAQRQTMLFINDHQPSVAFMNSGGLRADIPGGDVAFRDLFAVHPFGNFVVSKETTGGQFVDFLAEQVRGGRRLQASSNLRYTYSESDDTRILDRASVRVDGRPIEPTAPLYIVVNSYLAGGGDGLEVLKTMRTHAEGPVDVGALEDFLKDNAPLQAPVLDHIGVLSEG